MYVYVHIPFCKSKCSYCDFFSVPLAGSPCIPDSYIDALLNEAAYRKKLHGINEWSTIYFGGGTPGLLSPAQIKKLIKGLSALCPPASGTEITLEVNCADIVKQRPDGLCPYLENVSKAGINRISAGIQTFNDKALRFTGRRSSSDNIRTALDNLRRWRDKRDGWNERLERDGTASSSRQARACDVSCGNPNHTSIASFRRFSCDLIAGLPFLSTEDFCAGVNELLSYEPDHISLYSLMIEKGTPLEKQISQGLIAWDEDAADSQWLLGRDMLEKAGYRQYEVSNFAKPGFESVHNRAYWHMKDYIGLGPAAVGTVGSVRYTGTRDIKAYTDFWLNTGSPEAELCVPQYISSAETISRDEKIIEFLMMGFRLSEGVSALEFKKRFGSEIEGLIEPVFSRWQKLGLAERGLAETDGITYRLTKGGLLFLNEFLTEIVSMHE